MFFDWKMSDLKNLPRGALYMETSFIFKRQFAAYLERGYTLFCDNFLQVLYFHNKYTHT